MTIRALQKKDYPVIDLYMKELHGLHVQERPDLFAPLEHPYSEEEFFRIIADEKHITAAVAEENDMVIGFGTAVLKEKSGMINGLKTAYIDEIFVRKEYRRQGVAAKLLEEIECRAKERGAERIDLMVWEFNEAAIELYRSSGMRPQRYILEKCL